MTPVEVRAALRGYLEANVRLRQTVNRGDRIGFLGCEDLVLQRGVNFEPYPWHRFNGHPRQCFERAYQLANRANSKWIYCEGFAICAAVDLPIHHAWVIPRDGPARAYELAWADPGLVYLGLAFDQGFVRKTFEGSGRAHYSVLDVWWDRYPLLTGRTRLEDVLWRGPQQKGAAA